MHLKVLQLRYCGRDSIIQVKIDLIFIMVPLGEQKQMEEAQTYKTKVYNSQTSEFNLMKDEINYSTQISSKKNNMQ